MKRILFGTACVVALVAIMSSCAPASRPAAAAGDGASGRIVVWSFTDEVGQMIGPFSPLFRSI